MKPHSGWVYIGEPARLRLVEFTLSTKLAQQQAHHTVTSQDLKVGSPNMGCYILSELEVASLASSARRRDQIIKLRDADGVPTAIPSLNYHASLEVLDSDKHEVCHCGHQSGARRQPRLDLDHLGRGMRPPWWGGCQGYRRIVAWWERCRLARHTYHIRVARKLQLSLSNPV